MRLLFLCIYLIATVHARAQLPFTALWAFEGNPNGSSNQPNISVGGIYTIGVNIPNVGPYTTGQAGQAVNVGGWSQTGGCNFAEFIEIVVQPLNGQKMTLNTLSFYVNHSVNMSTGNTGPQSLRVRSSLDGYGSDLVQQPLSAGFQKVTINLGGAYANLTNSVTFHIHACPPNGAGTIRLDELTINGTITNTPLPVTLLSFTAKSDGSVVQLNWATTAERDADRFVVERSLDLREFTLVGEVTANGTTDVRQYYRLTDAQPLPGINYYRLKQIDVNGTLSTFKPISVVAGADDLILAIFPNPAQPDRIRIRLRSGQEGIFLLRNALGQRIGSRLEWQSLNDVDLVPATPLPAGLYWVEVTVGTERRAGRVLVR